MKDEVYKIINDLDTAMAEASAETRLKVWWILTALRGPDDEDQLLKHAATSVLREKVLPKAIVLLQVDHERDSEKSVLNRKTIAASSHFANHITGAFHAAGLFWGSCNHIEKIKEKKKPV